MQHLSVLVVDDENGFADILVQRLNIRGFMAHAVYGGQQAIDFVREDIPDVILLDVKMPLMSGIEVLRHIKQQYPSIAVIMLTGYSSLNDDQEALRLGAFDVLRKPPEIDVIVETLRLACKQDPA
ncbi:MAG: response regulator [Nitrospirae bacterium]|nr:response regulator [Nitrospirota bacterium]